MLTVSIQRFSQARALIFCGSASRLVSGFMLVAMLTVIGKGVSFVKDASVARWFGTSDQMDAFVLAFGFLGFAATVIGGGLPEAFLPFYASLKHQRGQRRSQRLAVQSLLLHAASLTAIALVLWLAAPAIIGLTARSFVPEKQAFAVSLLRQMLPFLICFGLTHQLAVWLRADNHFALAASAPMLIPFTILGFLATGATIDHLVLGTVWGSLLHVSVLGWVIGQKLPKEPVWRRSLLRLQEPGLRLAFRDALPYLLATGVYSSATVIDQAMAAAALPAGAASVLSYSDKLVGILLALTALPAGEVLFPFFAETVARQDWAALRQQLWRSALLIGGIAIPASLLMFVLAPFVVHVLFEHGAFTPADTERVAAVFRIAVFQVPFYIVGTLCSRVAVCMQATRFILILSVLTMACNAALNWPLLKLMGAPGIALSTVLVSAISCITVTLYILRQIRLKQSGIVVSRSHSEPQPSPPAPGPGLTQLGTQESHLQAVETSSPESVNYTLLTTSQAFLSLAKEWDDLLEVSAVRTPFMRWDWLELWWHHAADKAQIAISTARDANGHLLAVVPLMIRPRGKGAFRYLRELTFLGGSGEIDAEGLEAMVRPGQEHLLAKCWDLVLNAVDRDWDMAQFSYLDRASPLTRYLTEALERRGISSTEINPLPSRYIPLPQDWESYAQTRSKNFRKKLARLNRQAAACFKIEFHLPENATSASAMFRQLLDLHAERWSVSNSLFLQPRTQAFHADLIQRWIDTGRIVLMVMTFDGAPVAANYAFIDHARLWDYQGGWRTELADFGPSKLILQANISHAMKRGVKEYDFLPGPNPYKISWCPELREVFDLESSNPSSLSATIYTSIRTLKRTITSLLPARKPTETEPDPAPL